jgi:hypothetical protein
MYVLRRAFFGSMFLLAAATAPVAAQGHAVAAGYGGGFITFGALNPDVEGVELALDDGWVATMFGEAWHVAGGRLGARLNGAFTQRPLQMPDGARDINTWLIDLSLMLRLLPPREGNLIAPFLSAGGGIISYGLGASPPVAFPEAGVVYPGDNQRQFTLVGGGGFDLVPRGLRLGGTPLGLRLEVANHTTLRSPFEPLEGERLGPIHNLRLGASLIGLGWF